MICKFLAVFVGLIVSLAAHGCIVREPGTIVELTAVSIESDDSRAKLTSDRGYVVELDSLYLVLGRVELVPCQDAHDALSARLREIFGISVARAHGQNTPTIWAVPNVLAPLVDRSAVNLAVLHPPAIDYCAVRVSFQAADQDAERMPSEVELIGRSMYVSGSYGRTEHGGKAHFAYQSETSSSSELLIVDGNGDPTVLSFSEDQLRATLRIELAYTRLFDGIPLIPGEYEPVGDIVLGQALEHVRVVLSRSPN